MNSSIINKNIQSLTRNIPTKNNPAPGSFTKWSQTFKEQTMSVL